MQRADGTGAGALEVVRLAPVAGPVHGQRGGERDLLAAARRVRVDQPEVSVDVEEQSVGLRPAGRGGKDVTPHGDRCAVHDEGAGRGGRGRGAQVGQAPGGRHGGGHELGAGVVGVLGGDRARAVGGHRGDRGRAQGAGLGDDGPHEQHSLPVGRPGGVEVLPAGVLPGALLVGPPGEPGQPAGAHVHGPDAVRRAGHGVAAALGGECDPGAVRRPGRAPVVPRPVGELPQPGAVGPQRPEVEASAAVGADGEAAAVGRELRAGGFEAGRRERDGGAALARDGPEHVLHLGDQAVTGRGEGRGATRGGGEGEGGRGGGCSQGGCTHRGSAEPVTAAVAVAVAWRNPRRESGPRRSAAAVSSGSKGAPGERSWGAGQERPLVATYGANPGYGPDPAFLGRFRPPEAPVSARPERAVGRRRVRR